MIAQNKDLTLAFCNAVAITTHTVPHIFANLD